MWRNWSFSLIAILMAKNSGKLLTQMGCGTSSTFSPIPASSDYLQLTCHCLGISHLVSTNILELKLVDQLWGQGPLIWSDLLQWWPAPEKPLSHTEIYPNCPFPQLLSMTHMQRLLYWSPDGATDSVTSSPPMSGILTNIWSTYLLKICPRTHVAVAQCAQSLYMIQSGA